MAQQFYFDKQGRLYYGDEEQKEKPKVPDVKNPLLFVYGTLRYHNKHLLKGGTLIRRNVCAPHHYYLGIYKQYLPVMVAFPGGGNNGYVMGDIYQVPYDLLLEIDKFKLKNNSLYQRKAIVIGDYGEYKCQTYMYPIDNPPSSKRTHIHFPEYVRGDYGKYLDSLINEEELLNG